jgi:tellurite methyltransferase
MLQGTWRVLKPRSLLFCHLASSIGMENQIQRIAWRRFTRRTRALPGRSEALLLKLTEQLGGQLGDPLKTTVVQNQRCLNTWILRKN